MKVVTWNVNGIRARKELLARFIKAEQPDVLMLQETKAERSIVIGIANELGYLCVVNHCDATNGRHGVATLVNKKHDLDYTTCLLEDKHDGRYVSCNVNGVLFANVYVNQGREIDHAEYDIKLEFLADLAKEADEFIGLPYIVAGDFNVCITDQCVWSIAHWDDQTINCSPRERDAMNLITESLENSNVYEDMSKPGEYFSWYDYKSWWRKEKFNDMDTGKYGLRLDYVLGTITAKIISSKVLFDYRLKGDITPSDHCPVLVTLEA